MANVTKRAQLDASIDTLRLDTDPATRAAVNRTAGLKLATDAIERRIPDRDLAEALDVLGITRATVTPPAPRRVPPPAVPLVKREHGTDAGWHAHRRRGEDPCPDCDAAHAEALTAWATARAGRIQELAQEARRERLARAYALAELEAPW